MANDTHTKNHPDDLHWSERPNSLTTDTYAAHWQNNGQAPWNFPPTLADLQSQLAEYRTATKSLAAAYEATIARQAEEITELRRLLKDLTGYEITPAQKAVKL